MSAITALAAIRGREIVSAFDIHQRTGMRKRQAHVALNRLWMGGKVVRIDKGRYRIADDVQKPARPLGQTTVQHATARRSALELAWSGA